MTTEELKRYANGQSSFEERQRIDRWLLEQEKDLPEVPGEREQLHMVWERLSNDTGVDVESSPVVLSNTSKIKPLQYLMKVAASVLFIVGFSWCVYHFYGEASSGQSQIMRTVHTEAGQKLKIRLPDGSKIVLNSESELCYPEKFAKDQRLVTLRGEAFFDIAHDSDRPFIVHTDSTFTEVLGTQFDLKAYSEDKQVLLTVTRGKVRFGRYHQSDQVLLTAGMQGVMNFQQPVKSHMVDVADKIDWTENSLVIKDEKLADVAKRIERMYGVEIIITSKEISALTVTGTFKGARVDHILNSLSFSTGVKYTIKDKIITIRE